MCSKVCQIVYKFKAIPNESSSGWLYMIGFIVIRLKIGSLSSYFAGYHSEILCAVSEEDAA